MIYLYSTLKTVLICLRAWGWNQTFVCLRTLMFVNGISVGISKTVGADWKLIVLLT